MTLRMGPTALRRTRLTMACATAVVIAGCTASFQTPPSPAVRAFGDNKFWVTVEPMEYVIGKTAVNIVVPQGFVTDFASIPQPLSAVGLSAHGQYSRAAIVHDFLYWTQSCTRAQSDRLMVIAMKESAVGRFDEFAIYRGVNLGGQGAWDQNRADRESGAFRVLPDQFSRPADPNLSWPQYRATLPQGIADPIFPKNPVYCALGDSTQVP